MTAIIPDHTWKSPSTQESVESLRRVQNIIGDFDSEYTMKYYDEWSQHYEKDLEVRLCLLTFILSIEDLMEFSGKSFIVQVNKQQKPVLVLYVMISLPTDESRRPPHLGLTNILDNAVSSPKPHHCNECCCPSNSNAEKSSASQNFLKFLYIPVSFFIIASSRTGQLSSTSSYRPCCTH